MKTKTIIGIVLPSAAIALYLFMRNHPPSIPAPDASSGIEKVTSSADIAPRLPAGVTQSKQDEIDFGPVLTPQEKALLATGYLLTAEEREKLLKKTRAKDLLPTMEELKGMCDTPVEFYGQVLDQLGNPVVNAKITCSWPYMGPMSGPVRLDSTAPKGQFEILELKAASITFIVEPPQGYAQLPESKTRIQFAKTPERILQNEEYKRMTIQQQNLLGEMYSFGLPPHKPNKAKPMIFRLKKL